MVHFLLVLLPSLLGLAICGGLLIDFDWNFKKLSCLRLFHFFMLVLCLIGTAYAVVAVEISGPVMVQSESSYAIQDLKTVSGSTIQVIVDADDQIINLTHLTGKVYPPGIIKFQTLALQPTLGLYFGADRNRWVPGNPDEQPHPAKILIEKDDK